MSKHDDLEKNWEHVFTPQPTPESNIEEILLKAKKKLADYYNEVYNNVRRQKISPDEIFTNTAAAIQALLTAADQAGYTRGRGEAGLDEARKQLSQFKAWLNAHHNPDMGSKDRWEVAAGEIDMELEVRLAELQKEAKSNG